MTFRLITRVLIVSLLPLITSGQTGFESIKICHDETGTLKRIQAGKFAIELVQSRFAAFRSVDNDVNYNATERRIYIEGNSGGKRRNLSLQLTEYGLLLSAKDTSVKISSITTVVPSKMRKYTDTTISVLVGDVFVPIEFRLGQPYRIYFGLDDKFLSILIQKIESLYIWNFIVESAAQKSKLTYVESVKEAPHITIQDDIEKVGIALYSLKSQAAYKMLLALSQVGSTWNGSGKEYQLNYNKHGRLKKGNTKLNLNCE